MNNETHRATDLEALMVPTLAEMADARRRQGRAAEALIELEDAVSQLAAGAPERAALLERMAQVRAAAVPAATPPTPAARPGVARQIRTSALPAPRTGQGR